MIQKHNSTSVHKYEILDEIHATTYPTYLLTGVSSSSDISFEVDYTIPSSRVNSWPQMIGADEPYNVVMFMGISYESDGMHVGFIGDTDWSKPGISWDDNGRHTLFLSSTEFKYDGTTYLTHAATSYASTGKEITIATSNYSSASTDYNYQGRYKYHRVKMWDGNTLVRDFVAAKRLSDNAIGMYDYVSGQFVTSDTSTPFAGTSKSTPEYIDEGTPGSTQYINNIIKYTTVKTPIYELVEEIHNVAQTTPQSYFDTDYVPQSDTEIELRFKGSSDNTGNQRLYYVKSRSWNATDQWQVDFEGNNKLLTYKFNNNRGQYVQTNISMDSTTIHTIKHNNSSLYYDGTEIATHSADFYQGSQSWLIGATLSDPSEQGLFNFYYVTIRESGQDVHRWLPAKRLSDDVLGLYDEVDGTFTDWTGTAGYTSKSTPEYIYGETQECAHINRIYLGNKIYWGNDGKIPPIPQQYIVVDYIRSVGLSDTFMSYINTGWRCSNNTVFEYKMILPSDRTLYNRYSCALPYGAHTWTSASTKTDGELSFTILLQDSDLRFMGSRNINDYDNEVTWRNVPSYGLNDGTRHEIIATISTSSFDVTVDNNNSVLTPASGPWSGLDGTNNTISELYLFTGQWPVRGSSMTEPLEPATFVTQEMYYFKIYDNNVLVRDYVPVYDTVSQKYGLYDRVNDTFNVSPNNINFTGPAV